jgi:hypothetical protein
MIRRCLEADHFFFFLVFDNVFLHSFLFCSFNRGY